MTLDIDQLPQELTKTLKMKAVFVTTGATVTFKKLIELVLDQKFLSHMQNNGFKKLILQYGTQSDGLELFKSSLKNLGVGEINIESSGITANYNQKLLIEGFPFTNDIKSVMSKVDLIISHAGTGSILDSLRLKKPLIVVINTDLMNNHQAEIADELEKDNHLLKTSSDLDELISNVTKIQSLKLNPLPKPNTSIINNILKEI